MGMRGGGRAFIITFEAIVASILLILVVVSVFNAGPHVASWDSIILKDRAYSTIMGMERDGTLEDGIINDRWSMLEYRANASMPAYTDFRITVYNETGAVIWNSGSGVPPGRDVVVVNYYTSGENETFSLNHIKMEAWYR